jgi:hypothetical protein
LDRIFGMDNVRGAIIWNRAFTHNDAKKNWQYCQIRYDLFRINMTVMSPSAKRERRRLGIMKVAENTSANALVLSSTTGQFPYESEDTRDQPEDLSVNRKAVSIKCFVKMQDSLYTLSTDRSLR